MTDTSEIFDVDLMDISVGTREEKKWGVNVFDSSPKNMLIETYNSIT